MYARVRLTPRALSILTSGILALLVACGPASAPAAPTTAPIAANAPASSGKAVSVLYAGSLVNLMEKGIGPAFRQDTGTGYQGQGAGSVALANAIKDKTKTADVFISA